MDNQARQYIVQKTLDIVRAGLPNDLTIPLIAKKVGYSQTWLGSIFRKSTGRSLIEHIVDMKIEEAKRLLAQTNLNVIEIALEAGFGSHEHFARTFRNKTGITPSRFRNANLPEKVGVVAPPGTPSGEAAEDWFAQNFQGENLSTDLKVVEGNLTQWNGYAAGSGIESFGLVLLRNLPENMEISIDVKMVEAQDGGPTHLLLYFGDEASSSSWYQITLGEHTPTTCAIKQRGAYRSIQADSPVRPNTWHRMAVQISDDFMRVGLDGQTIFQFQNDFPPSYNQRCRLWFGSWHSSIHFRKMLIRNLGIPVLARVVRQGDSLYNAQSFTAAREFYCRLLETQVRANEHSELQYKIGMCFFAEGAFSQARTWLEKAAAGDSAVWVSKAEMGLMRLDLLDQSPKGFAAAERFLASPAMRDETRTAIEDLCKHYETRGEFDRILPLKQTILDHAPQGGLAWLIAQSSIAQTHGMFPHFEEAEQSLKAITEAGDSSAGIRSFGWRDLGFVYQVQGKLDLARECYDMIQQNTTNEVDQADADIHRAFVLRGRNQMDSAMALLEEVSRRRSVPFRADHAKLEAALILCGLERVNEAWELMRVLREAGYWLLNPEFGSSSWFLYVPELISGNYRRACELLMDDSRRRDADTFSHGQQAMAAGFVAELLGDRKKARQAWTELLRRFPLHRCAHLVPFAEAWLNGAQPDLMQIPIGSPRLSEMHYLAGLVWEKRGDRQQAQLSFEHSVQLDRSLRWNAYLAKRRLESYQT